MSKALLRELGFESEVYYDLGPCRDNAAVHMYRHVESRAIVADPVVLQPEGRATERSDMQPIDDARRAYYTMAKCKAPRVGLLTVLDIGCGYGGFVERIRQYGARAVGCDPGTQWPGAQTVREALQLLPQNKRNSLDCVTLWHVLEHIPEPFKLFDSIPVSNSYIIEVPSAHDPMIEYEPYRRFVFRSDHYCLHSEATLRRLLRMAFSSSYWKIEPLQRYTLGNALNWVTQGKPTGLAEPHDLAWAALKAQRRSTDTLIAIGHGNNE
jgi:SAM-dependent methyltransferase